MQSNQSVTADQTPNVSFAAIGTATLGQRASLYAVLRLLAKIQHGSLRLTLPNGELKKFVGTNDNGPAAEIVIRDLNAIVRLVRGGDIGLVESYLDCEWDTPDLSALLDFAVRNEEILDSATNGSRFSRMLNRLRHWRRSNSRKGSRRNIQFHYDLGNDFYRSWLDASMTYSAALFADPSQGLVEAQQAKYQRIADLAELKTGSRVLEIGCGWGGFMEYAAGNSDIHVHGVTLSREQLNYANRRMQDAGLDKRAIASLTDYRDTSGQYDAVVSIEMLEAVGEAHWPCYFQTLHDRLKPGASAVVQVITIEEERFAQYRQRADFIQRFVFPGGMLPSQLILRQQAAQAGLTTKHEFTFGQCYAQTLEHWRERFRSAWPNIARLGFDQRFRRLWEYYLHYCETGFRAGTIDVGIYQFCRTS